MIRFDWMRWLGLGAVFGGLFFSIYEILFAITTARFHEDPYIWTLIYMIGMFAALFVILGVIGIYAYQANDSGAFGLATFILTLVGLIAFFGFAWGGAIIIPAVVAQSPSFLDTPSSVWQYANAFFISHFLFAIGVLLFGIMILRNKIMPRGAALLIIVGSLAGGVDIWDLGLLDPDWGPIVLASIGFVWLGIWLWRSTISDALDK